MLGARLAMAPQSTSSVQVEVGSDCQYVLVDPWALIPAAMFL